MVSKYYSEHIEKRKFYCLAMSSTGDPIGGWVDAVRATKNSYEIVKCDFNLSQGLILEKYINKVKTQIIVADTQELAEQLYIEACEKGLMYTVKGYDRKHTFKIDLDNKYKSLVEQEIIKDKGGYFKSYNHHKRRIKQGVY